jgi:hypothetical protein
MILFRVFIYLLFFILVGIGMVLDIRKRTFPVWLGWALLFTALAYLVAAGEWGRVAILAAVILGFRLRKTGWVAIISMAAFAIYMQNKELTIVYLTAFVFYFLFTAGLVGTCDAEVAFPMIALTGDQAMLIYILAGWILIPPIVVFIQRGVRGGFRRFAYVAKSLLTRTAAPKEDTEALRWPWVVTAFTALFLYYFIYPGIILSWIGELLS